MPPHFAQPLRTAANEAMDDTFRNELPLPWEREPPLTRELVVDSSVNGKTRFFQYDLWHSIHLGVGKTWISGGVMMLQKLLPQSNQEERISAIGSFYKLFCRQEKLDPVLRKIDLRTFGTPADPSGSWNKAAVTANWFLCLEAFCAQHHEEIQRDERMRNWVSLLYIQSYLILCICFALMHVKRFCLYGIVRVCFR